MHAAITFIIACVPALHVDHDPSTDFAGGNAWQIKIRQIGRKRWNSLRHEASPPVNTRFALLLFILGLAAHEFAKSSPPVRQVTLDLDRAACKIDFTLGAVMHTVHGTFEVKDGMLRLDALDPETAILPLAFRQGSRTGNDHCGRADGALRREPDLSRRETPHWRARADAKHPR